ncbi:ABC transporter ATP-binding protein [Buchananella felis]|uniref:ATP-binding cassette domain-containing protein n=1 Tax=Buchananella felis TaxID=3231492 RepID=UPI003529533B
MFTLNNLSHRYGRKTALDGLNVALRPGVVTGLIGPNGSGKTTLMKSMAGYLPQTGGQFTLNGREVDVDARLAWCAYAGQIAETSTGMLGYYAGYAACRPTWDQGMFDRLLSRFGLSLKDKVTKYSRGQSTMLVAAGALASGAPVVLLDEVQATMDVPNRYALYEEITRIAAQGERTIIVSSHLVSELENLVEDVVILKEGKLLSAGPAEELRSRLTALVGPADVLSAAVRENAWKVVSSRELGPTREVVLDCHPERSLLAGLAAQGVQISPVPFQDAFVHLIQEEN